MHWLQLIFRLRFSPVFEYTWVQRRICGTPQDWTLLWDSQTCVNWKTTVNCAGTRSVVHCLFMFIHELPNFFMWNKTKLSLNSIRKFIKSLEVKYMSVLVANHWSGSKGIWKCTKSFLSFLIAKIKILFLDFPTAKSTEVGREGRSSKLAQKSYVECWLMLGGEGRFFHAGRRGQKSAVFSNVSHRNFRFGKTSYWKQNPVQINGFSQYFCKHQTQDKHQRKS